jgi:hypothetical protein
MGFHHHYVHGPRLIPRLMGSASGATSLLGAEADGLSIDFTDASLIVRDTTTTSNVWLRSTGDVQDFWRSRSFTSYASPSPKITRDSDGYYKYRPHNILPASEKFELAAWTKQSTTIATTLVADPFGGTEARSMLESAGVANHDVRNTSVTLTTGVIYTLSAYVKSNARTRCVLGAGAGPFTNGVYAVFDLAGAQIGVVATAYGSGWTAVTQSITSMGSDWYRCSVTYVAGTTATAVQIMTDNGAGTDAVSNNFAGDTAKGLYIYGAQLNAGPTALTYVPTRAHNLCLQSQVAQTTWTYTNMLAFGAGSTADATTAPDGTTTADLLTPDTANGSHNSVQSFTAVAAPITMSQYVKPNGYSKFGLREGTLTGAYATFNLSGAGSVIAEGTGGVGAITLVGNGWYRVSMTFTATAASHGWRGYILNDAYASGTPSAHSYAADGVSGMYEWGRQVELASSPGKYVATTTAAVYSANYDLPREWNSSGVCQGLLVEEARTNICLYARDLTQSNYVKTSATAALTATGVDGVANTASTLTASAANGTAVQNIVSASAARSLSMFVKRRTGTGTVTISHGATTGSELVSNGAFGTDTSGWTATENCVLSVSTGFLRATETGASNFMEATTSITTTVGKLYRVSVDLKTVSGGASNTQLWVGSSVSGAQNLNSSLGVTLGTYSYVFRASATTTYVELVTNLASQADGGEYTEWDNVTVKEVAETDITSSINSSTWTRVSVTNETITNPCVAIKLATSGDAIDVDYCQSEAGAFITSPIYTGSASVTRAADLTHVMATTFPLGTTAGTLYVKASRPVTETAANRYAVALNDTTINEMVGVRQTITSGLLTTLVQDGGVAQATLNSATVSTAGVTNKVASSYVANDFAQSVNGAAVQTDVSGTLPTPTRLEIGALATASPWNGHIAQIMVLNRAMTDGELIAVST